MKSNIGSVIVTFNRLEKLKKTLRCYDKQNMQPKYIIVVNNASTDGTKEYLSELLSKTTQYKKIVINLDDNIGGSGGFYEGQKVALKEDADWIMLADDDAYPDENYISTMQEYIERNDSLDVSVICGRVFQLGTFVNQHRARIKYRIGSFVDAVKKDEYNKSLFECDVVSYVGPVIKKEALNRVGLVNKDYFILYDDTEHSLRLRSVGKLICITKTSIYHDTVEASKAPTWKSYYEYRNQINLTKNYLNNYCALLFLILFSKALLCPLRGRSITDVITRVVAIKDGLLGNMGKKNKYVPGRKNEK